MSDATVRPAVLGDVPALLELQSAYYSDELYVAPAWRGRGLGHQALKAVDAACIQLGVEALHLEVERSKTAAQALYRRWGFADRQRVLMTKWMGPQSAPRA